MTTVISIRPPTVSPRRDTLSPAVAAAGRRHEPPEPCLEAKDPVACHPTSMIHAREPREQRLVAGVRDGLMLV